MKKIACLFALLSFVLLKSEPKIILFGVDGCRPDVLMLANTPNFDKLMANGTFTLDAKTDELTYSGPGWSSMLTGVPSQKHEVYSNKFENNNTSEYPHFFARLDDELKLVSIAHWFPINKHLAKDYSDKAVFRFDPGVTGKAVRLLKGKKAPDVMFLHYDAVDHAGHSKGFGPDIPEYVAAIEKVDKQLGKILKALEKRKAKHPEEDWMVLASTDHGGRDKGHSGGKDDPLRRNIFIIASGDNIPNTKLNGGHVMDVAVTALDFMGVAIQSDWGLEGNSMVSKNN